MKKITSILIVFICFAMCSVTAFAAAPPQLTASELSKVKITTAPIEAYEFLREWEKTSLKKFNMLRYDGGSAYLCYVMASGSATPVSTSKNGDYTDIYFSSSQEFRYLFFVKHNSSNEFFEYVGIQSEIGSSIHTSYILKNHYNSFNFPPKPTGAVYDYLNTSVTSIRYDYNT